MSTFDRRRTPEEAWEFEQVVMHDLQEVGVDEPVLIAGSMRRHPTTENVRQVVGDLDLIVVTDEPLTALGLPGYLTVTKKKAHGWRSIIGRGRMMVDLWACPEESLGPFAMFLTGPMPVNVAMRQAAKRAGLMLTQYGLFEPVAAPTKTYPNRLKPGRRMDTVPVGPVTMVEAEKAFWEEWRRLCGLPEGLRWPYPHERSDVPGMLIRHQSELLTAGEAG